MTAQQEDEIILTFERGIFISFQVFHGCVNTSFNMNEASNLGFFVWLKQFYKLKNNCIDSLTYPHNNLTIPVSFLIDKK